MTEGSAKYVANAFAVVSALFVPIASYVHMGPFTPTCFAGASMAMIYAAANPKLLIVSRSEWKSVASGGTVAPIALVLGALLMIIGLIEAGVRGSAT